MKINAIASNGRARSIGSIAVVCLVALVAGCDAMDNNSAVEAPRTGALIGTSEVNKSGETTESSGGSGGTTTPEIAPELGFPGTLDYSVPVVLPGCDAPDAVRISTSSQLVLLSDPNFRVFCIEPGDYRSAGTVTVNDVDGSAAAPRFIRYDATGTGEDDTLFDSPLSELAMMPNLVLIDSDHWVIDRLAFINVDSTYPIKLDNSESVVINRIRMQQNRTGIGFYDGSHESSVQNSLIGDMDLDLVNGNDAVCVALRGKHSAGTDINIHDVKIVNNEIYNCNDGIQLIHDFGLSYTADFQGALIAGNDIYIDSSRYSDCNGNLTPSGPCACTENAIDLKTGSYNAVNPVLVTDNRMWGWRRTDRICHSTGSSWGTAIDAHFAVGHTHITKNVMWDNARGIALVAGVWDVLIEDNIIRNTFSGFNNEGYALITADGANRTTVRKNHIVNSVKWVSAGSPDSRYECNVLIDAGNAVGSTGSGTTTSSNAYFNSGIGALGSGTDLIEGSASEAEMGQLCVSVSPMRVPGGQEICLAGVLSTGAFDMGCGSPHWSTVGD